jgi:hypothetical protein
MVDFANAKTGKIISFRGAMTNIGKTEFMEFKSISFEDREEPLDPALIEEAISFDEVMKVLTPDEIKKIMYSGMGDDEEADEPKPRSRSKDKEDDSDGSDEEAAPRSRRAAKDDEDEDEKPRTRRPAKDEDDDEKPAKSRKAKDEDDEEDERPAKSRKAKDDEDDDEKPAKDKPKAEAKADTCPEGYAYPEDWDKKKGCEKCKVWDRCNDAYDALKKKDKD